MRAIVTGGGTGGHIYPALAIARGLRDQHPGAEILYVGTSRGLEADLVPREGIAFRTVTVEGWGRKLSLRAFVTGWKLMRGLAESWRLLRTFRPQVVIGTGGFVCGPVVLAAAFQGVPTVIHEQNALPGMTNRWLARFVDAVCLTFPEAERHFPKRAKVYRTGLPVRPEMLVLNREEGVKGLGLMTDRTTILVVGGSRGARSINRAVVRLAAAIRQVPGVQLLHATGAAGYRETSDGLRAAGIDFNDGGNITIMPYIYHMEFALAAADLIISRAGASFLSEALVAGLPSILVPYPHAAENHQEYNARALASAGAAVVIRDAELTGEGLSACVLGLLQDRSRLKEMATRAGSISRPGALDDILAVVARVAGSGSAG